MNEEASTPLWMEGQSSRLRKPLDRDVDTEVCVVGAGIAGLTAAYLLAREGAEVIVLEGREIGSGQTGRTTAHLVTAHDDRYAWLESVHGKEGARIAAESHARAIDKIEEIVATERIGCDFQRLDGYLFIQPGKDGTEKDLREELAAGRRAGLTDIGWVDRAPIQSFNTGPCIRFPRQAQFHPFKYLAALADRVEQNGGKIFTNTHVVTAKGGSPAEIETSDHHTVSARSVVMATNTPIHVRVGVHAKQAAYRTYVIVARVPRGSVHKALYWDTGSPYHYVRTYAQPGKDYDLLVVGGEDHKTGQPNPERPNPYLALEEWAIERFLMIQSVENRWSGQVMETFDGLAFIGKTGKDAPNIYMATGDSGMGMTHGTMAGMVLRDLILGRENPWAALYEPGRITLRAAGALASETANFLTRYVDWVTPGDVDSASKIARGAGAVVRDGLAKLAVYRDENGELTELSAVCPHMGCVVEWNEREKTWDCPCHGSRFEARGRVIEGPSSADLPLARPRKADAA